MGRAFKKRPVDFLRLPTTRAYLEALAKDTGQLCENLTITTVGVTGGTLMHPDLGMEFARWLSPEFGIWCNRQIRRILRGEPPAAAEPGGSTAVAARLVGMVEALVARIERLEQGGSAPAIAALPQLPPPTLDGHVAQVLLAAIAFPRDHGLVHPVEIARAAVVEGRFTELCDDPADPVKVSRLLRFFQGRGFFQRWLRAERGWLVFCEPMGRNRHRRYSITARREGGAA